jgi:hypothetical protein
MYLDQWGMGNAQSGQSCANLVSLSGTNLAWKNAWNWQGGNGVKSYTNINLNANLNKQLSAIRSINVSIERHHNIFIVLTIDGSFFRLPGRGRKPLRDQLSLT